MKRFRHYSKDKAILISAFGSVLEFERYMEFRDYLSLEFGDFFVYMSFSSSTILKSLSLRGIEYKNQVESLAFFDREGYRRQIVLSLNLFPTDEHNFCLGIIRGFQVFSPALIRGTRAILTRSEDANILLSDVNRMVRGEYPGFICLYVFHGSPYFDQAGLQSLTYARDFLGFLDSLNFVCSLEGAYSFSYLREGLMDRFKALGIKDLLIVPLLLVSGSHFVRDIRVMEEFFSLDFAVRVKGGVGDSSRSFCLLECDSLKVLVKRSIEEEIVKMGI